jgi:hypothetical protein
MERFQLFAQYISRLPIPEMADPDREAIGGLAMQITERARARYALHQQTRHRVEQDLGTPGKALNQKLAAWWELEFPAFRAELQKVFRQDVPVRERGEWEEWLAAQRAGHARLTGEIVALETELNDRVYRLFNLTPDEIRIIEETTKYRYGEV